VASGGVTDQPRRERGAHSASPVVYVVDDEPLMLDGLLRLLRSAGREARAFHSPLDFLREAGGDMAGCLLLDVQMPGVNGLDLQQRLAAAACHLPIIFLTGQGDIPMSVRAMKAGAVDFLIKPVREKELFEAIERALEKDARERGERQELAEIRGRSALLTPREREVFSLVTTGMLNKEIADQLGTSEKTVKVHRGRVMVKMRARSLADLVRLAGRLGLPARPPGPR
jgi:FixJ family two-component response regulator